MVVGPLSAIRHTARQTDLIGRITVKCKQDDSGPLAFDAVVTGKIVTDVSNNLLPHSSGSVVLSRLGLLRRGIGRHQAPPNCR